MKHVVKQSLIMAAIGAMMASCTANGKLQQYIEDNNIRLAGKEIGPGIRCEGMTIDRDTVIVTYSLPRVEVSDSELANWDYITRQHKQLFLDGLRNDKDTYPEGAHIITDADVYMKGVFKYANASLDVMLSPEELDEALK